MRGELNKMLTSSIPEGSNQLKLNLDALVSNLNLVNIIQQPRPIMIENVNNKIFSNYNQNHQMMTSNGFNLINEDKLKMFSFLAERKLKEKEWHSKYFSENTTANANNKQKNTSNTNTNNNSKEKVNKLIKNNNNPLVAVDKKIVDGPKNIEILFNMLPLDVKINEMKIICKNLMSAVESLEKVLTECKIILLFFELGVSLCKKTNLF